MSIHIRVLHPQSTDKDTTELAVILNHGGETSTKQRLRNAKQTPYD